MHLRTSLFLVGLRVATMLPRFLMVLFLARFMGVHELGQFALLNSAMVILPAIMGFGIMTYLAREAVTQPLEQTTADLLQLWRWATLGYAALLALSVPVASSAGDSWIIVVAVALAWLEHINNDAFQILLNRKQPVTGHLIVFIRQAGWTYLFMLQAYLVPSFRTMEALALWWLLGQAVGLAWFGTIVRHWPWRQASQGLSIRWLKTSVRRSRLFWLHNITDGLSSNADRLIISALVSVEMTGIYTFFWQIANAIRGLVYSAIYQPQRPYLIEAFSQGDLRQHRHRTLTICRHVTVSGAGLMAVTFAMVWLALPYLGKAEIMTWFWIFPWILAATLTRIAADAFSYGLFSSRQDTAFVGSFLLAMGLSWGANLALVPWLGIFGASLAGGLVAIGIGLWSFRALDKVWRAAEGKITPGKE